MNEKARSDERKKRACLKCREEFMSKSAAHRICSNCSVNNRKIYISTLEPQARKNLNGQQLPTTLLKNN